MLSINGAQGTIYEGEQFQLQFRFGPKYPFDSPEVTPFSQRIDQNQHVCFTHLRPLSLGCFRRIGDPCPSARLQQRSV